jgi:hypothetical protein
MTAIVKALDSYTPLQIGENGHVEYGWSNNIQEKIIQFSFQTTRDSNIDKLHIILVDILTNLKNHVFNGSLLEKEVSIGYLSILYKMIGHTRDIIDGKGEAALTYMMIYTWYDFFPELATFAIRCLVDIGDKNIHQYGSWKDIKYFCKYCKNHNCDTDHPLIKFCINLINEQLKYDYFSKQNSQNGSVSLVAKWVPREKSSFGWLYESLATNYFSEFLLTALTDEKLVKAVLKAKTQYRKILSHLNRQIDTLQIKQCGGAWTEIDFNGVTSISNSKQKKAFLNIKKNGEIRYPEKNDRVECAEKFKAHIQKAVDGLIEVKGKRVGMADFTKQALEFLFNRNNTEEALLNSQWRDNSTQTGALGKMIAMVDVSASMKGDPMHAAIALGIRIAEKSVIGKRVMTFSSKPKWINLEYCPDFVSQVHLIRRAEWGMNTNFHAALDTILDAIIINKMSPQDVQDMVLVVLSDMQMDKGDNCDKQTLYELMKKKYELAGIRINGMPFKPPHILFWNLRSTSGFPSLSNQPNSSMMSGFSPSLLNLFCEQGIKALQSCTPWSLLERSLENERYKIMSDKLSEYIGV